MCAMSLYGLSLTQLVPVHREEISVPAEWFSASEDTLCSELPFKSLYY